MSTALITGASSGIGEDIARQLAARGLNLILVARRKELLDKLADELAKSHGITTTTLACDLADRESLGALFEQVDASLARHNDNLAVLVNNAGTGFWAPFADQDLAGILPTPQYATYSGTKGYVRFFTEILDYELRDSPISVTAACPGGVLTPFLDQAGQTVKKQTGIMTAPEVAKLCVNAMYAGKVVYVPGLLNKVAVYTNLLPRRLRGWLLERSMMVSVEARPDASR